MGAFSKMAAETIVSADALLEKAFEESWIVKT
jgi:hypothetical protein